MKVWILLGYVMGINSNLHIISGRLFRNIIIALCLCFQTATCFADPLFPKKEAHHFRLALLNTALSQKQPGKLHAILDKPSPKVKRLRDLLQALKADILILLEVDFSANKASAIATSELLKFNNKYLGNLNYTEFFLAPFNTGIQKGYDLDQDGFLNEPEDALGYGRFPGQYGMGVLSRLPINAQTTRQFRTFPWSSLPDTKRIANIFPIDFPLSSKSHWDIVLRWQQTDIHLLVSHPTPPVFDGPEDRNGRRNNDEILFWHHYITQHSPPTCCKDDRGYTAHIPPQHPFIIAGDLNNDPNDGEGDKRAIKTLLSHPRLQQIEPPASKGGIHASLYQKGLNLTHRGNPAWDTADFADRAGRGPGNLRVDYILPSQEFQIHQQGIFWPKPDEAGYHFIGTSGRKISDHRLIWMDLSL